MSVYVWIRTNGILIAVGNTLDEAYKNLTRQYPVGALEIYVNFVKLSQVSDDFIPAPAFVLDDASHGCMEKSKIIEIHLRVTPW